MNMVRRAVPPGRYGTKSCVELVNHHNGVNSGTASPYSGTASDTVPARFDVVPALRMFQRLNVPE